MRTMLRILAFVVLPSGGWASPNSYNSAHIESCIAAAAHFRNQNPNLLKAIAVQESGLNPSAVNRANKNGSVDHGLFQINSAWLPTLARHGITEQQLYDPCVAAYVAAWILAMEIDRHGSTWRAVGAYNSPTEKNQKAYAGRIQNVYYSLTGNPR